MNTTKTIKALTLGVALSINFTSCSGDRLDPFVPGVLTEEVAISNSTDLQGLLNSSYGLLSSRQESVLTSVFTDEVGIGIANGGQGISAEWIFMMNGAQALPEAIWTQTYIALSRINRVISIADKLTPTNAADAKKIEAIKAQALTLRAYCHLRILSYFTTDMKSDSALAGILATKIFTPSESQNRRVTNGEFYAQIHADLMEADGLFDSSAAVFSDIAANKFFALGLRARAYLYQGKYAEAKQYANQVINTSGITLADKTQYRNLFFSDNQPSKVEVVFKLKRTVAQNSQATNLHNGWASVKPLRDGSVFYEVGRSLHNLLNPNNVSGQNIASTIEDVRANVIIGPTSLISTTPLSNYANSGDYKAEDVLVINKHGGASTGNASWAATATNANNNDFKIMRISEMHLIVAEAEAQMANYAAAAAAIKKVRDARYGSSQTVATPGSKQDALQAVLLERRLEFAFEGYRFIDLKRLGAEAGVGIDRHSADYASKTANYAGANPANLSMTSHKWALPIPNSETNVNSVIQQNPGY